MGSFSVEDFLKKSSNRTLAQWKDDGKIIFFLHPKAEIFNRITHRVPTVRLGDDATHVMGQRTVVCANYDCAIDALVDICKQLPDNEPVLQFKYSGKREVYTASDITGAGDNEKWQRRLWGRMEWLVPIIRVPIKKGSETPRQEILQLTKDGGEKLKGLIKGEMEEAQEELGDSKQGNPQINPYAIRITFNDKATSPGNYYTVTKADKKAVTSEIKKIMGGDPLTAEELLKPTPEKDILALIKASCISEFVIKEMGLSSSVEKIPSKKKSSTPNRKLKFKSKIHTDEDDESPF